MYNKIQTCVSVKIYVVRLTDTGLPRTVALQHDPRVVLTGLDLLAVHVLICLEDLQYFVFQPAWHRLPMITLVAGLSILGRYRF